MAINETIAEHFDAAAASLVTDPLRFMSLCWPDLQLYDKQRDILLSVRDNVETFVHAANELGKDFIAAIVAIWFFASRTPARVVTSSSSETQLKAILWSEIRHRIETSRYPLPFRVSTLHVEKLTVHVVDDYRGVLVYVQRVIQPERRDVAVDPASAFAKCLPNEATLLDAGTTNDHEQVQFAERESLHEPLQLIV